jgi:hypothetical protein
LQLARSLAQNSVLTALDLSHNNIGFIGAAALANAIT